MTETKLKDRTANLGQLYGVVAAIRILAEESKAIAGNCFGPVHTEFLAMIAHQAEAMCHSIRDEFDKIKEQNLEPDTTFGGSQRNAEAHTLHHFRNL